MSERAIGALLAAIWMAALSLVAGSILVLLVYRQAWLDNWERGRPHLVVSAKMRLWHLLILHPLLPEGFLEGVTSVSRSNLLAICDRKWPLVGFWRTTARRVMLLLHPTDERCAYFEARVLRRYLIREVKEDK
jgi:hypothetical protein